MFMDYFIKKNYFSINLVILSLFLVAFVSLCIWTTPLVSTPIYFSQNYHNTSKSTKTPTNFIVVKDELEEALSKASMEDKTVIITIINKAYVEPNHDKYPTMFDLFLEGFWVGEETQSLLDHLLVVSMDQTAYDRCRFRRLTCYRLVTVDQDMDFREEKLYMSEGFIKMMWARTHFLLDVMKRGYNFIFTDTDVLWLRNPFTRLRMLNETDDLQISTDKFNGNPWSDENPINTGFYHIRSNNKTISLFENWYEGRQNFTGMKEQDVLESLIKSGVLKRLGLRVRFLDTLYFSGFCQDSKDVRLVTTVHANCCRSISAKVTDLTTVLKDWKRFKQYSRNATNNATSIAFRWSGHIACFRSWRHPSSHLH